MRASGTGPLAETLARLGALDPWLGGRVGRPDGADWHRFDDLAVEDRVRGWVDDLAASHGGHRDVAGSYLGCWLAGAATIVPTAALVLERRLPDPFGPLWIHRHPEGWFDRVAFDRPSLLASSDDAAAGHVDVSVVDDRELVDRFARGLAARLTPVLDAVRAAAPFGRAGLWGGVADELASAALWAARAGATDADAAWGTAAAITDALGVRTPWLKARPARVRVTDGDGRSSSFCVKSTCCLHYKTQPQPPDPTGDSYCTTCPSRDDASRRTRLLHDLGMP